jgi:energy-coupling factor transporter ATP-binding protein EcfA2
LNWQKIKIKRVLQKLESQNKISIKMITFIFSMIICLNIICVKTTSKSSFTISIEGPNKTKIEKDIVEFIKNGGRKCSSSKTNAIMVLGLTGTGKSTLINYLNGVQLVCKKNEKNVWILDLLKENSSLPCGFEIGHTTVSKTLYPAVYSPNDKDFSYIDNPGFKDNRNFAVEIANAFFREQITREVKQLKFLLLLTQQDLNLRGQQFRESIKAFSSFIGMFDDSATANMKHLSKSIGIVVTRVDNEGENDKHMIQVLSKSLSEILEEEKAADKLTKNEEVVFRYVIENNVEIFSNPKKAIILNDEQSIQIVKMVNRLEYVSKPDAKLRPRIDPSSIPALIWYLQTENEKWDASFTQQLKNITNEFYYKNERIFQNAADASIVYKKIVEFQTILSEKTDYHSLIKSIDEDILDANKRYELAYSRDIIEFLMKILPSEHTNTFTKKSVDMDLILHLESMKKKLIAYLKDEVLELEDLVDENLDYLAASFFTKKIDLLVNLIDLENLNQKLNAIQEIGSKKSTLVDFLNKLLNEKYLDDMEKNEKVRDLILKKMKHVELFINSLKDKTDFPVEKVWMGIKLIQKLNHLKAELNIYRFKRQQDSNVDADGNLNYFGYFSNLSNLKYILKIKDNQYIKRINVFSTHSFTFDVDFEIKNLIYKTDAPDLIIIAPNVFFNNSVTVDLSCANIPETLLKANISENGKPGKPGYNGGNLIIITDNFVGSQSKLNFISKGGQGGRGQNGE